MQGRARFVIDRERRRFNISDLLCVARLQRHSSNSCANAASQLTLQRDDTHDRYVY